MDWFSLIKDVTVLVIVPIIFWLRLLIVRQDRIDEKLNTISTKLSKVQEEILESVEHSLHKIDQVTHNEALAAAKTSAKVEAIESKVDMLLNISMKK